MNENRMEQLEIRISYLEAQLKQLNEVVLEQDAAITSLKGAHKSVKQQLQELQNEMPGPGQEKPPHY